MQTGPSTRHAACDYATRCVSNRSALQWRLSALRFWEQNARGIFKARRSALQSAFRSPTQNGPQPDASCSALTQNHPGTSERTAAHDFVPAKGLWASLTYLSPEQGTSLCQTVFTALPAARAQLGQFSAPPSPLYSNRRHTASPPPASAHGEVGRGLPMGA